MANKGQASYDEEWGLALVRPFANGYHRLLKSERLMEMHMAKRSSSGGGRKRKSRGSPPGARTPVKGKRKASRSAASVPHHADPCPCLNDLFVNLPEDPC